MSERDADQPAEAVSPAALSPEQQAMLAEEAALLARVRARLAAHVVSTTGTADFDNELLELRDQLAETRAEDHAMLVEHMTRVAALRQAQLREQVYPADPNNPYFAHLRLSDKLADGSPRVRDVLIGRRAFIDTKAGVQVVDWRNSPISRIYYCYQAGDEYEERFAHETQRGELTVRRTVTVNGGELVRVRDDETVLVRRDEGWTEEALSRSRLAGGVGTALRAPPPSPGQKRGRGGRPNLGTQKVNGRLPEITALIDPEQFRAITAHRSGVVIIRGGAGTGKTTIALHRAAWLHFEDPRRFAGKNMLVITPGDALRRYVAQVLPSLDVAGVGIKTFANFALESVKRLIPSLQNRKLAEDVPMGARRLKRHPVLLDLMERVVRDEARGFDAVFEEAGGAVLLDAWVRRRNMPVAARLDATRRWLDDEGQRHLSGTAALAARKILRRAQGELCDVVETWTDLLTDRARLQAAFEAAGEKPYEWELDQLVRTAIIQSDEPFDPSEVDEGYRAGIDGQALDDGELRGRLDVDDCAILLRLCQLKYGQLTGPSGQTVRYAHLVVDEAQDLSPLSIQVLCGAVKPGDPVTLAGDTAQRLVLDNGFASWDELIKHLRLKANILPPLAISYRSTQQVMVFGRHVLGHLAQEEALRDARDGAPVEHLRFEEMGEAVGFLADALKSLRDRERQATVALVARKAEVADQYYEGLRRAQVPNLRRVRVQDFDFSPGIDVTDVMQIKGLEYDYVVALEPTAEHYPSTDESRFQLHVIATRAAYQFWLLSSRAPSLLLPEPTE